MGKRDKRRRRDEQRARDRARSSGAHAGSGGGRGRGGASPGRAGAPAGGTTWLGRVRAGGGRVFTPELVDDVVAAAVSAARAHDGRALDNAVTVLARGPAGAGGPDGGAGQAAVDRALGRHLVDAVGNAWGRGWQPADLVRVIERQLGRAHGRLAALAVVHDTARYAPGSVPPRWRAQVDDLEPAASGSNGAGRSAATGAGAARLLDVGAGAAGGRSAGGGIGSAPDGSAAAGDGSAGDGRWAVTSQAGRAGDVGHDRDRRAAIRTVAEALALVGRLPDVPKLAPAPGDAPSAAAAGSAGDGGGRADARILHRVRSLLAKAESTTFPDEAEALTAKAQELMARHAIDAAVLDAERGARADVAARRVAVDDPYAGPKAILLDAIASANRCRSVWSKGYGYATVFGAEGDLDAVELLYTSLLVQAARAMLTDGPGTRTAGGRQGSGRTRSFRQSFLVAFATRIGARLSEAVETATDAYADQHENLLPVLAERRDAADAACDETFPRVRSTSVSANDRLGWQAGNDAAEAAQLDLHAPVGRATT